MNNMLSPSSTLFLCPNPLFLILDNTKLLHINNLGGLVGYFPLFPPPLLPSNPIYYQLSLFLVTCP